jgi:hypothetical protein
MDRRGQERRFIQRRIELIDPFRKHFYEHGSELRGENRGENSDMLFSQLGARSLRRFAKLNSRTGS